MQPTPAGFDVVTWLTNPGGKTRAKKEKTVKPVIYPIFADCVPLLQDEEWRERFTECSIGKIPKGFTYADPVLTFRKGAKTEEIILPGNAHEAMHVILEAFRNYGNIFSKDDLRNNVSAAVAAPVNLDWNRCVSLRDHLLARYVEVQTALYNLSEAQVASLWYAIDQGLGYKVFTKDTVVMESNYIVAQSVVLYDPDTGDFYVDPSLIPLHQRQVVHSEHVAAKTVNHERMWVRSMRRIAKQQQKYCGTGPVRARYVSNPVGPNEWDENMSPLGELSSPLSPPVTKGWI